MKRIASILIPSAASLLFLGLVLFYFHQTTADIDAAANLVVASSPHHHAISSNHLGLFVWQQLQTLPHASKSSVRAGRGVVLGASTTAEPPHYTQEQISDLS